MARLERVEHPAHERLRLAAAAEREQRVDGEHRIAHPPVAVVPVALAAEGLGERGRGRGDHAAGRAVREQPHGERAADDGVAPGAVVAARGPDAVVGLARRHRHPQRLGALLVAVDRDRQHDVVSEPDRVGEVAERGPSSSSASGTSPASPSTRRTSARLPWASTSASVTRIVPAADAIVVRRMFESGAYSRFDSNGSSGASRNRPPPSASSSAPSAQSPSKSGRQSQSIDPSRAIRAAVRPSPTAA